MLQPSLFDFSEDLKQEEKHFYCISSCFVGQNYIFYGDIKKLDNVSYYLQSEDKSDIIGVLVKRGYTSTQAEALIDKAEKRINDRIIYSVNDWIF